MVGKFPARFCGKLLELTLTGQVVKCWLVARRSASSSDPSYSLSLVREDYYSNIDSCLELHVKFDKDAELSNIYWGVRN